MWRPVLLIVLLAGVAGPASAEPITLQPAALHHRPAAVGVDTQNVTTIQFCSAITWWAYKAPWLHVASSPQDKRVLLLDASSPTGEAVVMVWSDADSTPLQFLVRVSSHVLAEHLYFVGCDTPAQLRAPGAVLPKSDAHPASVAPSAPARLPVPRPGPDAGWDKFVAGLSPHQRRLLAALIQSPRPEASAAFVASLSREQAAALAALSPTDHQTVPPPPSDTGQSVTPNATNEYLPSWIAWQAQGSRNNGGLLISYTVVNTGARTVLLDRARLRVTSPDGTRAGTVSLNRQDTSGLEGRLLPGATESGTIWIPGAPAEGVVLRWPLVEVGTGTTYLINERVEE
jgi:hypothetical protein